MITEVHLFSYIKDLEKVCAAAMRSCYSPYASSQLFNFQSNFDMQLEGEKPFDDDRVRSLLKKAVELGHHDILEHGELTYDIRGISRACSHQLVRHRLASYSQQSQRYVKITKSFGYVKPPAFGEKKVKVKLHDVIHEVDFEDVTDFTRQVEEGFVDLGVKAEDARYLRVNAAATNITVSMNPRVLLHVFSLRCAPDAQWEIRDVAWAMYACARMVASTIFEDPWIEKRDLEVENRVKKLGEIIRKAKLDFERVEAGMEVEIPLEELRLEHPVKAFVRKI